MKTYLPAIEPRIWVRPAPVEGILRYDLDNAYPQRVLEFVQQSPTAKKCWNQRKKFLQGNGFEEPDLGKVVINSKGLTLAKLLKQICEDKGLFPGFGLHVNYNANFKISDVRLIKYEDIRQGDTDSPRYSGKYVIYSDWGRRTWKSIYTAKLQVIEPFNPDPAVIKQQIEEQGGFDNYTGQLFYLTPAIDDYELCEFDAALEDIETEAGIKIFNNREVTTGFLPSTMLFMKARREEADNEQDLGPLGVNTSGSAGVTQLEKNLASYQAAKNSQKIIVIEYEDEADKPEFQPYDIQNNDKLFEATEKSVEGRIIKAFDVPKELVQTGDKNGLNASGAEKREAKQELNEITAIERMEISEVLAMIFQHFYINVNPSGNWNIAEITIEGSGADVVQNSDKVLNVLLSTQLKRQQKIEFLVNVYGLKRKEAEAMTPNDIKAEEVPIVEPVITE